MGRARPGKASTSPWCGSSTCRCSGCPCWWRWRWPERSNAYLGGRCRLKWPNDLLVEGRKLGGILIDVKSRAGEPPVAIISCGVNVARLAGAGRARRWPPRWPSGEQAPEVAALALELAAAVDACWPRRRPT